MTTHIRWRHALTALAASASLAAVAAAPAAVLAQDDPAVSVTTTSRCVAGKVAVILSVTNHTKQDQTVQLDTDYGTKAADVTAGRTASYAFSTRMPSAAGGTYTVDSDVLTEPIAGTFQALTCGEIAPGFTVTPIHRCVAGNVAYVLTVRNDNDVAVTSVLETPYGAREVTVQPGTAASYAFSSRMTQTPVGFYRVQTDTGAPASSFELPTASCL